VSVGEVLAGAARWHVAESRAEAFLASLPDNCVDLIVTDPPYHRVKDLGWDREHKSASAFLDWLGSIAREWARVLRPNGSIYCFASPQMAARVECKIAETFAVINRITWDKREAGWHRGAEKETLRGYFPASEAIIFAEHYGADNIAKGEAGYAAKCDELRGFVFEPLRAYLDGERERAGLDKIAINVACGFSASPGGMASRHYFSRSQWWLPTPEHYAAMRRIAPGFFQREYEALRREYEALRREYEALRREYEALRRPFSVSADVPYTDVWTFPTVARYPGKHPCEKPEAMARHTVTASSRPDAVVLDTFAGSGVFAASAVALGRRALACDMDPHWVAVASQRCANVGNVVPMVKPRRAAPPPSSPRPADERQTDLFDWRTA